MFVAHSSSNSFYVTISLFPVQLCSSILPTPRNDGKKQKQDEQKDNRVHEPFSSPYLALGPSDCSRLTRCNRCADLKKGASFRKYLSVKNNEKKYPQANSR